MNCLSQETIAIFQHTAKKTLSRIWHAFVRKISLKILFDFFCNLIEDKFNIYFALIKIKVCYRYSSCLCSRNTEVQFCRSVKAKRFHSADEYVLLYTAKQINLSFDFFEAETANDKNFISFHTKFTFFNNKCANKSK